MQIIWLNNPYFKEKHIGLYTQHKNLGKQHNQGLGGELAIQFQSCELYNMLAVMMYPKTDHIKDDLRTSPNQITTTPQAQSSCKNCTP